MPVAATGEHERQVLVGVRVGAAEAAAVEDLRVVEQRFPMLLGSAERREKLPEGPHLRLLDLFELGDLLRLVAMVRQTVGLVLDARHVRHHRKGAERERDHPRGIGLKRQPHEVVHKLRLFDHPRGVGDVVGLRIGYDGLRPVLPVDRAGQAAFEFADTRKILVEPRAILRRDRPLEPAGLVEHEVEHAATGLDPPHRRRLLLRRAGDKQAAIEPLWARLGLNANA